MRLDIDNEKLAQVKATVKDSINWSDSRIEDFIDGGDEGWDCGDDEQQEWLDTATADEIAAWVIAGHTD